MTAEIVVTDHAYKRAKERLSWRPETIDKMSARAFEEGKRFEEFNGSLQRYLYAQMKRYQSNGVVHGEVVYFFRGHTLVTVMVLPKNMRRYVR